MPKIRWSRLLREATRAATDVLRKPRTTTSSPTRSRPAGARPNAQPSPPVPRASDGYPGDFTGRVTPKYCPELDGEADPGEIVWTWVPYEEDHSQGKDRPVLVVGTDGPWLLGLMLTSKDHDDDPRKNGPDGPRWVDIGSGPWDSKGRESEIFLDRVIRVDPATVRREGAIMDRVTFERVVDFLT